MIDSAKLLKACQALVRRLEVDLRERVDAGGEVAQALDREFSGATAAGRTARSKVEWVSERLTQGAASWVLGVVFVRFLEDNHLIAPTRLSGPGQRLAAARDAQAAYFRDHPDQSVREYLLDTFAAVEALPGGREIFDRRHAALWQLPISGDAAREVVEVFREVDPDTGQIQFDFTDPALDTRFLGDLYQDLSEYVRKQYALLQTPDFIEEFILDHTLTPAIDVFGLANTTLIDPACGSGHFLLGAFARLLACWREREPGIDPRTHVERVFGATAGVDLNPYAVAIARFRLLIAALNACTVPLLADAPTWHLSVVVGDSLLHGGTVSQINVGIAGARRGREHVYATEDLDSVNAVLDRRYTVVVGNPPYITPKDSALKQEYRDRYASCSGAYALSVPFAERLFDLASESGFVGQITSNSFMKREFGRKLIEEFFGRVDLTLVVDTSGAYIPGHGTPTVILVGRNRSPSASHVRAVLGIRGDPMRPDEPARGPVWTAILAQVGLPGSESEWVSAADVPRINFARHPWRISGDGAAAVVERLEGVPLAHFTTAIGRTAVVGEDDAWVAGVGTFRRMGLEPLARPWVTGDAVRDWSVHESLAVLYPYAQLGSRELLRLQGRLYRWIWPNRTVLKQRTVFDRRLEDDPDGWWGFLEHYWGRLGGYSLSFAEVATHNHFALDRAERIHKQTAPVIRLRSDASESDYLGLLGVLNSSTACFWLKQACQTKGSSGIGRGVYDEKWEFFYQLNAANVGQIPVAPGRPVRRATLLDELASELTGSMSNAIAAPELNLAEVQDKSISTRARMIATQEELDWEVYGLYGLVDGEWTVPQDQLPELALGERAFEIVLAREMAAGGVQTSWFERHGSTPISEIPNRWPAAYRELVQRRIDLLESDPVMKLLERPEYKRRWQWEPWEVERRRAFRSWLLDRLEEPKYWDQADAALMSCALFADRARADARLIEVAQLYAPDRDIGRLVQELVLEEAVPAVASQRYTESGMRVRAEWERTWQLQRQEDAIDGLTAGSESNARHLTTERAAARMTREVGTIPVPGKYSQKDFRKPAYWKLRGKLDVPKERFILYPGAELGNDRTPVIGWAGWDHVQRARALTQRIIALRDDHADLDRLVPLLAGLYEVLPWVNQWHPEAHPALGGETQGAALEAFLQSQLDELHLTTTDLKAHTPLP